jgi:hypothetical protein
MDFFKYISILQGIFLHPVKSYSRLLEEFRSGKGGNIVMLSIIASLAGNICLSISNKLSRGSGPVSPGFLFADVIIWLCITGAGYIFSLAMIHFFMALAGRKIDPGEFISLFLSSDFLFIITLPVTIILSAFPSVLPAIAGLIFLVIFVMNIILKIRAIKLCSEISNFGSAALFFSPLIYIIFFAIIGAACGAMYVFKLLTY